MNKIKINYFLNKKIFLSFSFLLILAQFILLIHPYSVFLSICPTPCSVFLLICPYSQLSFPLNLSLLLSQFSSQSVLTPCSVILLSCPYSQLSFHLNLSLLLAQFSSQSILAQFLLSIHPYLLLRFSSKFLLVYCLDSPLNHPCLLLRFSSKSLLVYCLDSPLNHPCLLLRFSSKFLLVYCLDSPLNPSLLIFSSLFILAQLILSIYP